MTTPKKIVHWALDTPISDLGSPFSEGFSQDSDVAGSSLQYINAQLVSHGYTGSSGLSFEGLSETDTDRIAKCLLAMLGQRVNDISRAEDLSTKLRTLTYDHERLTSMHRSAKEQAANAEREMNVHKSRLATTTRTLHTAESAHKHTTAELQRTRTSIQALRASHTSELKKKERDVERMTEKWTKLAEAQSKLSASSAASGMTIRGANADVVTGSEVLWQGRTVDEEALEQAEQARAQLYEENGRLRRLVISSANELQRVVWSARSLTCDAEEEPQPLTSVELFPIAPVGAANDRFAAMFTTLEDTLAYLPERLANGELATRSMKASKSGEEQLLPKANLEAERLQGVIDSLQAELDETRKLHQAQAAETQELYEQLSAQQVQHDGDINAGADEAREDLAGLRVQIEEERRKLAKEKAAFETDRIRLRDEKRSFQADQMLSPPPQPAPVLAPAASTSRRHAPVPKPALASPHAKSPPRKSKPPAIAVGVAKAKAKPGLGARGSKRTVGRRSSAAFNAHANASISSRHEPAYETEVIPETISAAALAGADGVSAGAGALGLGAPAFELPKRRESILPTSFVLPPPSPRTSLPPANSIPFSLLPPETPLAGYGDEDDEGTTPSTVGPVPAPGATDSDGDGYTPPSAPQVQVTAAPEPDPAPSALAPPAQTPARPFPRARTLAPHMTHAYSPAKPSPLSRILMLARDSPESPEETQKQVLAASRAMGLAAGGAGQHACAEGERSPEGISTPIVLPRLGGGHAGEREEESPLREKRAEANVVAVPVPVPRVKRAVSSGDKKTAPAPAPAPAAEKEKDRAKASTKLAAPAISMKASVGAGAVTTTRLRAEKENRAKAATSKAAGVDAAAAAAKVKSKGTSSSARPATASLKNSTMARSTAGAAVSRLPSLKGASGPRRVPIDSAEAAPARRG